jgi:hypothetical protein
MPDNRPPKILRVLWILYGLLWLGLFIVIAMRMDLIPSLIQYRKAAYIVGVFLWDIFVIAIFLNKQLQEYVERHLSRVAGRPMPLQPAGVLFGLAGINFGLYTALKT